jgi:hypothetical protein
MMEEEDYGVEREDKNAGEDGSRRSERSPTGRRFRV